MSFHKRIITFGEKSNLALIYDEDDNIIEVFKLKDELLSKFNVSLYARPKNMKNFYDKIVQVAEYSISYKDYLANKEFKKLI